MQSVLNSVHRKNMDVSLNELFLYFCKKHAQKQQSGFVVF